MSIVDTSEEGKEIVAQISTGTGQIQSSWKAYEDKSLSELLSCKQVDILLYLNLLFLCKTLY